jgi:hypothetical protein
MRRYVRDRVVLDIEWRGGARQPRFPVTFSGTEPLEVVCGWVYRTFRTTYLGVAPDDWRCEVDEERMTVAIYHADSDQPVFRARLAQHGHPPRPCRQE